MPGATARQTDVIDWRAMAGHFINPHLDGDSFAWPADGVSPRAGTGVLLVHGFTATTAEVRPLARRLAAAGYSVAGPLLPGHGTAPEDLNRRRWAEWAEAVEAAYQALSAVCRRVIIGGESMGGLLALNAASRHPEAAAVLLYAPAIQTRVRPAQAHLAAALSGLQPFLAKRKGAPTAVDALWQGYDVYPARALGEFFRLQAETRRRLAAVSQPVLTVLGRLDGTVHPGAGGLIAAGIASARHELHWMERSSHCVILDDELPRVAELTLDFLAGLA